MSELFHNEENARLKLVAEKAMVYRKAEEELEEEIKNAIGRIGEERPGLGIKSDTWRIAKRELDEALQAL